MIFKQKCGVAEKYMKALVKTKKGRFCAIGLSGKESVNFPYNKAFDELINGKAVKIMLTAFDEYL